MSEELKQEVVADGLAPMAPPSKPKQYLVMVDELSMAILGKLIPSMLFVQVEGMAMQGNDNHMLLVNPLNKPTPVTMPVEAAVPAVD